MNGNPLSSTGSLPLSLEQRVDEACDRFEKAWKDGHSPRIEDYLVEAPQPDREPLFVELLALEIELRRNGGERPTPEDYHQRFREQIECIQAVFADSPSNADGAPSRSEGATTPHPPPTDSPAVVPAPPPPSGPPPVPDHIGRYKVVCRLGGGGVGEVYLAHDSVMDRRVAVKVPSAWLVATERAKEEFLSEARSAARLQHEGIVRAYDFGEADGQCYLVYEYVEGTSLAERIKPERLAADPLPPDGPARIIAEVAEALHHAHLQEMFHRDVKPANILLDRRGKPKVTDFGLAVHEEDLARQRGILAGTLHYMSPEQVRRESHHIDGRTDIYSLGVVLYELLCSRRPFEAKTKAELEAQILHREAKPPRQIKDSIPAELERICLKALSKRINDRYTTARDMAEELRQLAEGTSRPKLLEGQVVPAQEGPDPEPPAVLVIGSGAEERTYPLTKDRVVIGRNPGCDIVLASLRVARYHAQLVRDGGRYLIEDLECVIGTHVNGHQIRGRTPLKHNDRIDIGGPVLLYRQAGSTRDRRHLPGEGVDRGKDPKNLLHLIWDSLDPNLQDAFSLAYNKKRREGSNRISTRDLFQALLRISDDALRTLIESLPEGALPDPVSADVGVNRELLNANPLLSDCVEDSLRHFIKSAPLPRKLSPVDIFVDIGQHGHGPSVARLRKHGVTPEELEKRIEKHGLFVVRRRALTPQEVGAQMASADEHEVRRLLVSLQETSDSACVPLVFGYLSHSSEAVRRQAREILHSLGWAKVSDTAEAIARRADAAGIAAVLDGLAAFEAHPRVVALLDRLVVLLTGDLRNRAILLLERKRLGLELDAVAGLFRDIHSPYRIEKALGQGLFAAAYLAQADGAELEVVVRVLRPEFAIQPNLRAQFLDLSKKALHLVHENLVLTREARAFPERNMYFAVRDYVNGVTLQKLLEGGKSFGPAQIVHILRQLLAAVGAVHRRGMAHGGVKPSNVFVCEEDRVVLGDPALPAPGIGVALERLSYDYRYAAPETFRSGRTTEPQADFYSMGCVAYELACGEPPFVSDNCHELATSHVHRAIVPPSQRGSRLGPLGDEILLKLLARFGADRYVRVEDVRQALDGLEASWRAPAPEVPPRAAPLLRDASLARFRGTESVVVFESSAASLRPSPDATQAPAPAPPPQEPTEPKRIGNYEILGQLGMGGMGIIYQARHIQLNRLVALKMLRYGSGTVPDEVLTRFRHEALAVAKLQDPHIVQIYDVGEHEGQPYIVLEYIGGGSLANRLCTERPTPRAAAELVAKLARAIHHAHEYGVLHRDLKPSNILLTPEGEPKIADFGLAKMQESTKIDPTSTQSGVILGTPAYMAPEQAAGKVKELGPAADIYGLGAILYQLLTGQPPFQGASAFETLAQLAARQVVPPHALNPAVSLELSSICLKCLAKDPHERYGSAQGLSEDLERWLAGQPITALRATLSSRLARWFRRSLAVVFPSSKRA